MIAARCWHMHYNMALFHTLLASTENGTEANNSQLQLFSFDKNEWVEEVINNMEDWVFEKARYSLLQSVLLPLMALCNWILMSCQWIRLSFDDNALQMSKAGEWTHLRISLQVGSWCRCFWRQRYQVSWKIYSVTPSFWISPGLFQIWSWAWKLGSQHNQFNRICNCLENYSLDWELGERASSEESCSYKGYIYK